MNSDLVNAFIVMGEGIGGIFLVMIIIALIVALLTKLTNKK